MSLYARRGVSAQKEEVHAAIRDLPAGLYPHSFCKIYPDILGGDDHFVNVMHADGAGTKSILAYLYWKETGDISVWEGIARDAVIMNLDDLLCAGIYDNIVFNSTIDRNKNLIPGEVLEAVISGTSELFEELAAMGVHIHYLGGETADVGDVVRTIAVNGTMCARWPKDRLITNDKITAGDVIVGFAGYGRSTYEKEYNSGIGSNGLTSARHDVLGKHYATVKESYDPSLENDVTYIGNYRLSDTVQAEGQSVSVGKLLLSPTRTFAPLVKDMLQHQFDAVHGMIHCSGGGQTKILKYLPEDLRVVKDTMLKVPPVFDLIKQQSGANNKEMYQVFNMGCRLEVICKPAAAQELIRLASAYHISGQVTGRIEKSDKKELLIMLPEETLHFHS